MSGEIARQTLTLKASSRRRLEERVGVRFPRLVAFIARALWRLPARSRLRRAALRRAIASGWQALNRGDLDVAFALYHPEVASTFDPGLVAVGLESTSDREARIRVQKRAFDELDFRFESEYLVDLEDGRLLSVGRMKGTGLTSGAVFDNDWAAVFTIAAGWVIEEQIFLDRRDALAAVGLSE